MRFWSVQVTLQKWTFCSKNYFWTPLGTLGSPLWPALEPLGRISLNSGASGTLPGGILLTFPSIFKGKITIFFEIEPVLFIHPSLPSLTNPSYYSSPSYHCSSPILKSSKYYKSPLSFQSLLAPFPPILQASKHPMGDGGMRGAFEIRRTLPAC